MRKGIMAAVSAVTGAIAGAGVYGRVKQKEVNQAIKLAEKNDAIINVYRQWLSLKQEGKSLEQYLTDSGYHKIAIYGMGCLGESLLGELKGGSVEVRYAIDRNAENIYTDIDVVTPEEDLPEVEAVIVTAITFFDEIEEQLSGLVDYRILSLEDLVYDI